MKKQKVTLYVSYDGYMDAGGVDIVEGRTILSTLRKVINNHCAMAVTRGKTQEELIEEFSEWNGDGCDYIISIIQDDGTIIYRCDE